MTFNFDKDVEWARDTPVVRRSLENIKVVKAAVDKGVPGAKRDYDDMIASFKHDVRVNRNYFAAAILKILGETYEEPLPAATLPVEEKKQEQQQQKQP